MSGWVKRLGGKYFNANIGGEDYEILDGKEFIPNFLTYPDYNKVRDWELSKIGLFGDQGSGKTNLMRYICKQISEIYKKNVSIIRTNSLIYVLEELNKDIDNRKFIQVLVLDDGIARGMDSRRSMSGANVNMTQEYFKFRHHLANEDDEYNEDPRVDRGICFLFFAVQDPTRLDSSIRKTLDVRIYMNYYAEMEKAAYNSGVITNEDLRFINDAEYEAEILHKTEKRALCLVITKGKRKAYMDIPFVSSKVYDFPKTMISEIDYSEIINYAYENYHEDSKMSQINALIYSRFLDVFGKRPNGGLMKDIRYKLLTKVFKEGYSNSKHTIPFFKIHKLRNKGLSYGDIKAQLGLQIDRIKLSIEYKKWCLDEHMEAIENVNSLTKNHLKKQSELESEIEA